MASKSNDRIQFKVGFDVDKSSLNSITKALQDVQKAASSNKDSGLTKQFNEAASAAKELERIVNQSWNNKLDQLNLNKFNQSVQQSFGSVQNLKNQLAQGGAQGQAAFNSLASSVLNTNIQLKQSNKLLDSMATSMANTVKWGITASIFNNITGSIQKAFYYAKDLNSSLTDIRMVTGAGADQMQRFAKNANDISKNLGRSTLDFTKSAVEYYRQGLSDEEVQERSQITLKAQNITGAGNEMVDYLTSVWNGFKATREQAEGFVDSMALVADSSASDLSELATAMSKVAATANVVGVDFDQLNAQIATVVATTRLAPESVGTAFKTIYSRINDIAAGSEEAQISLGRYSSKMAELGFNVLDANGRLRDTGDVIEEIGSQWQNLTKEQQTYLASTMGGQRQITQVMALFDNWNTYVDLLNTSLSANGTLNEKNNIYLESTAAHLQQLGTQAQRTYDILIDTDAINGLVDALDGALGIFNDFIEGIGGGANAFAYFGSFVAGIFSKQITQAIIQAENSFKNFSARRNIDKYKEQYATEVLKQETGVNYYETDQTTVQQDAIMHRAKEQAQLYAESLSIRKGLTQEQQKQLTSVQQEIGHLEEQKYLLEHIQSVRSQIGAEDLTDLDAIKQRQQALKEQDTAQSKILSTLSQIDILNKRAVLSDQDETNLRKQLNVLYQQGLIDVQQYNILLQREKGSENIINSLLNEQKVKYYDIHGQLQEITNLKQLQEALDRGDLEVINGQLIATRNIEKNLNNTGKHALSVQKAVKGMSAAGQLFTAAAGALPTLMDETATGAEKANAAFSGIQGAVSAVGTMFGPIGMGVATLVNGALSLIKSIFPGIERAFMSAEEKLAELQNTVKEVNEQVSSKNKTISSLEAMQEEYAKLSQAAGEYGKNVDKMTEEDRTRYHELTNEFASYNDSVIVGYDAQGNAIVKNQEALQQTIQLLREQRKQTVRNTMGDSNTAISQANETLLTSQEAYEKTLNDNVSFSDYIPLTEMKRQLGDIQESLNTEIQNLSNWYDGSIDQLLNTVVDGTDKTVEEILNAFNWDSFQYGDQVGISKLYNSLFNMLKGQGGDNVDQADAILNLLSQYDDFYGEYGDLIRGVQEKIKAAQELLDQDVYFDTGFISNILQFGQGYDAEFEQLRKSEFFNSDLETLVLDYIDGFKYNADLVDKAVDEIDFSQKEAGTYDQIIEAGQNFITFLTSAIEDSDKAIKEAFENNDIQSADDLQGTITERLSKATTIINDVLSNLKNSSQYQMDDSKREALAAYIAQALGIDTLVLKPGENGIEIDTIDIVPDQIVTDAKAAIEQKFKDQKIFVTTEVVVQAKQGKGAYQEITRQVTRDYQISEEKLQQIFEQDDLANIGQILNSIWGGVEERIAEGQSNYDAAIENTYNEYKQLEKELNNLTNIDFDSAFTDFDSLIDTLSNTKQLKDEQKEYLNLLESQDDELKRLALQQGRGSEAYINYLSQRKSLGQQIYLQEQQAIIDASLRQLQLETDANKRLQLEHNIEEAYYNQARAAQAVKDAEKAAADAALQRQMNQAQTQLTTAQNMRSAAAKISNQINFGQSQALTTEDLTALNYLNSLDSELAKIAQEQGIYSQEYLDKLYQAIAAHGDLNTIAQESTKAVLESRKAQAQTNLDEANAEKNRLIEEKVQEWGGFKTAQVNGISMDEMRAQATQWLAVNSDAYQQAEQDAYTYEQAVSSVDMQMLQLQADTAAAMQQASKHQISIDVMANKSDLFDALVNTQELSDAQMEYVLALEASDEGLAKIASTSGRYSKQYQQALKKVAAEDMKLYKQQIEEQKKRQQAEIEASQAILDNKDATDAQKIAAEIVIQNAKNKIIRLDDQILVAEQAITKEIENQQQATLKLQQQQTQDSISNVKNLSTAIEHLKSSSQDITTNDYTAIYDWLLGHPELAELAGQNLANIFDSSFINALERSYKNDKGNVLSGYFDQAVTQAEAAVAEASKNLQQVESKIANAQGILSAPDQFRNTISPEEMAAAEQTIANAEEDRLNAVQQLKQASVGLLEAKSQENEQNRIALATDQERLNIFNQLTNRSDLNSDEQNRLDELMDDVAMQYPQLSQAANLLKDTWLVGTQEYSDALKQIEDQLEALKYKQLQSKLDNIAVDITLENLDDCRDEIEEFLDADREIIIAIHTDAENEFDRLQEQMQRIYDASSMIGENFVVAADDIRELNNVFPGILDNMQDLHDGTVQLNQDAVQQAIAGASDVVAADAQSVNQQLQSQANLLHAKAANYRAAAQAAANLAQAQANGERGAAADRETVFNALMTARADMAAQAATSEQTNIAEAAQAESTNFSQIATNADANARIMSQNFASAGASMSTSISEMANSAIQSFAAIAEASRGAANGEVVRPATGGYTYSMSYGGQGGSRGSVTRSGGISSTYSGVSGSIGGSIGSFLSGVTGGAKTASLGQQRQSLWKTTEDLFNQLALDAEKAATDIEGMIAEAALDLNNLGDELTKAGSGRPSSGKGKGGGGGGGGSGKDSDTMDLLEDQYDRYHDINLELTRLANNFEKLADEQEKLFGKDLIDNLNAQLQNLEDQISAYKFKIKLARTQQIEMQAALRKQGALFDANGYISNYNQLMYDKINKVNTTIEYYNTLSAAQQESYKDVVEAAKQEYEDFKEQIESYDTLVSETIPELEKNIREKLDEQTAIRIEHFKISVELQLDMAKAEREWNKFRKRVIDGIKKDDVLGTLEASFIDLMSYYSSGTGTGEIGALTDQVNKTLAQLYQIDETGTSDVYGNNRSQALQDLQNYMSKLMDSLQDVEDVVDEIEESIFDAIKETQEAFENQVDLYDHISDIINHDVKVVQLIYGDKAYDTLSKYYAMQHDNDLLHLDFLKQQKELWYQRMQIEQQRMSELDMESNEWKSAQKRFNEYKEKWMDITKELNSAVEDSVQNIISEYTNVINKIFDQLQKKWTSGKGMSYVEEEWELINKYADLYLDKVNSMYEIQKLEDVYKDALNDIKDNVSAQQDLNNLMEQQLKYLRDKDRLTQYDVDRANLLLQIEIKRLALEQSRNNKTKLRLRRDRQGNYSYQYTSDDSEVSQAREELNDLTNQLYNLTHNAYTKNLEDLYQVTSEYEEKIKEVYEDTTLSAEEQQAKLALYNEYYGNIINELTRQNEQLKHFMFEDSFNALLQMYENNLSGYRNMTDQQKVITQDAFNYFYTTYNENLRNFRNMTDSERSLAAYTFAEMARQYGLNVLDFGNMTAEQEALAADLFQTIDLLYGENILAYENMIDSNIDKFHYLSQAERQILTQEIVPQWQSSIQVMANLFAGEGGFIPTCEQALMELESATFAYQTSLKQVADMAGQDFNRIKNGIDEDINSTKALIDTNTDLINKYKEFIGVIDEKAVNSLKNLKDWYDKAKKAATDAAKTANDYIEKCKTLASQIAKLPAKKTVTIQYKENTPTASSYTAPKASAASSKSSGGSGGGGVSGGGGGVGKAASAVSYTYKVSYWNGYTNNTDQTGWISASAVNKLSTVKAVGLVTVRRSDGQVRTYSPGHAQSFKSGGYTGEWSGQDGKLAVLHQKEIVLNETDTKNILSAVNVVRTLNDLFAGVGSNMTGARFFSGIGAAAAQSLDQNVHITATFPNVTEHTEIEKALNSLVNRASQFAYKS